MHAGAHARLVAVPVERDRAPVRRAHPPHLHPKLRAADAAPSRLRLGRRWRGGGAAVKQVEAQHLQSEALQPAARLRPVERQPERARSVLVELCEQHRVGAQRGAARAVRQRVVPHASCTHAQRRLAQPTRDGRRHSRGPPVRLVVVVVVCSIGDGDGGGAGLLLRGSSAQVGRVPKDSHSREHRWQKRVVPHVHCECEAARLESAARDWPGTGHPNPLVWPTIATHPRGDIGQGVLRLAIGDDTADAGAAGV